MGFAFATPPVKPSGDALVFESRATSSSRWTSAA
jgi:hypothetical protein